MNKEELPLNMKRRLVSGIARSRASHVDDEARRRLEWAGWQDEVFKLVPVIMAASITADAGERAYWQEDQTDGFVLRAYAMAEALVFERVRRLLILERERATT